MFSKADATDGGKRKSGSPTIISSDLKIGGDLTSEGEIQVDGTIEGDVRCNKLSIGESGVITGAVAADHLLVRGQVDGQIKARMVILNETARVNGDVYHETLCIESGAQLEGHCRRLNAFEENEDEDIGINLVVDDGSVQPFNANKS